MGAHNGVYNTKMIRLLLVCSALAAAASSPTEKPATGSNPNTRIFGLGNLVGGALTALTGGGHGHHQGGFNQGHHGHGVVNPGFNQGFNQGGLAYQGGFPGGVGVGGGFPGHGGGVIGGGVIGGGGGVIGGGGGSASCRRWCRTPQGQAYCCEGANEPISAAVTKQGQCPPVRPSC